MIVLATARLLLCHSRMPQMGCSIIEDGGDLVRTSIMSCLPSDPKCFFHELIQPLNGMIELARRLSETLHVELRRVGRGMSPAMAMLQVRRVDCISHVWLWPFLSG